LTLPLVIAAAGLLASLAGAYALARANKERVAFAAFATSPFVAALLFVLLTRTPTTAATAAATPASPPAATQPAPASTAPAASAPQASSSAAPVALQTSKIDTWRREADELRRGRKFSEARDLYTRIVTEAPADADAWADLADATAAAAGGDLKAGTDAINHALAADPNHLKALWLKASLELQEKRYSSAVELWERLLAKLPKDSNDARIVTANLEETRTLAKGQGPSK
jgi:cytochrome c-type biogenesis protein CcmH